MTFGWGPRFLHSTGQFHKGGPAIGVFLQIVGGRAETDLEIPGRPFTFGQLIQAQAAGDASVLAEHGRPVLTLTLRRHRRRRRARSARRSAEPRRHARRDHARTSTRSASPSDRRLNRIAGPSGLIIFGVTGDLSRKKLMPAVYDLANRGLLPPGFALVGFARRDWDDQDFEKVVYEAVKQYARTPFDEDVWRQLQAGHPLRAGRVRRRRGLRPPEGDPRRARREPRHDGQPRLLPVDPAEVVPAGHRAAAPLRPRRAAATASGAASSSRSRSVTTCKTARELNDVVESVFPPDSVFRIDHYLGKETVQNILALRFANQLYEPIWNANYVDHVQITMAEDIGVGGRAGYYDGIGAARDVIQNHLLQLLALTAMEEPVSFDAADLRAEKEKVLSAVHLPKRPRRRRPPAASTRAAGRAARRCSASSRKTA